MGVCFLLVWLMLVSWERRVGSLYKRGETWECLYAGSERRKEYDGAVIHGTCWYG